MFVEFCSMFNNLQPLNIKFGLNEPLLIIKTFVKHKPKVPTETRYRDCRSNVIMSSQIIPFFSNMLLKKLT